MTGNAWSNIGYADGSAPLAPGDIDALNDKFDADFEVRQIANEERLRERIEHQFRRVKVMATCLGQCRYFVRGRARFTVLGIQPEIRSDAEKRGTCLCVVCVASRVDFIEYLAAQREGREPRWDLPDHLRIFR